jgi:hypothetical protein
MEFTVTVEKVRPLVVTVEVVTFDATMVLPVIVEKRTCCASMEEATHVETVRELPVRLERKRVEVRREEVSKEDT